VIAIAASSALLFNLLCTGLQGTEPPQDTTPLKEALIARNNIDTVRNVERHDRFSREFRVDLARKRWCYDRDCATTVEIARVSADQLLLDSGCGQVGRDLVCSIFRIDRESGRFHFRYFQERYGVRDAVGVCVKRPGRSLPKAKF
jgi:hypothetical protein